jgi:hypothetical protein
VCGKLYKWIDRGTCVVSLLCKQGVTGSIPVTSTNFS